MNNRTNSLGQPIGYQVPHWKPVNPPPRMPIAGRYCRIEPIDVDRHAADLFEAISDDADGRTWTYMAYGPFGTLPEYRAWMKATCLGSDPLFHAVIETATNKAVGVASYLRIDPKFGVIE
ncbi:MAG TPA: GNAT family N-acetyltransferase, partial [Dongiaceae bacterium]|nr:GNAT family N-acetyltransferase [Dongiaceae bacterium]